MPEPVLWPLDDHTRAKHRVLAAYLAAWLPVMGQQAMKTVARGQTHRVCWSSTDLLGRAGMPRAPAT
jgi:hypothetical protein